MRINSQPIRFNEDWSGVFLRGDDAYIYAAYVKEALDKPEVRRDLLLCSGLKCLLDQLHSCIEPVECLTIKLDNENISSDKTT